jgi:hypothetical protein
VPTGAFWVSMVGVLGGAGELGLDGNLKGLLTWTKEEEVCRVHKLSRGTRRGGDGARGGAFDTKLSREKEEAVGGGGRGSSLLMPPRGTQYMCI